MNQQKIGNFIKECRNKKNLTQQELANQLFVTDRAVSKWENGHCLPDITLLEPLSIILGVEISELIKGEKIPKEDIGKINSVVEEVVNATTISNQERRRNINIWLKVGLGLYALFAIEVSFNIFSFLNNNLQEFIRGLMMGATLACFIVGYLVNNKYLDKAKEFKKKLIKY